MYQWTNPLIKLVPWGPKYFSTVPLAGYQAFNTWSFGATSDPNQKQTVFASHLSCCPCLNSRHNVRTPLPFPESMSTTPVLVSWTQHTYYCSGSYTARRMAPSFLPSANSVIVEGSSPESGSQLPPTALPSDTYFCRHCCFDLQLVSMASHGRNPCTAHSSNLWCCACTCSVHEPGKLQTRRSNIRNIQMSTLFPVSRRYHLSHTSLAPQSESFLMLSFPN